MPKQFDSKWDGVMNTQNYNVNLFYKCKLGEYWGSQKATNQSIYISIDAVEIQKDTSANLRWIQFQCV